MMSRYLTIRGIGGRNRRNRAHRIRRLSVRRRSFRKKARVRTGAHRFVARLRRVVRVAAKLVIAAIALLILSSVLLIRNASEGRIFENAASVPPRYTALVLGAKVYRDGTPSMILRDRLQAALDLYRQHKVRKILVSGSHPSQSEDEVGAMAKWLCNRGVPEVDIFLDHAGFRTLDSMVRASEVFGVREAVICTQAFHLPRSIFLARRSGIDAVGLVSDRRKYRHHAYNHIRELAAKTVAVLDSCVFHRGPRFLGAPISIHGDGRETQDRGETISHSL